VSAFSSVKKSQLKKWFGTSAYDRLSVLLLYGPSGTGKKSSLKLLLQELDMQADELDIDKPLHSLPSILGDAYAHTAENIIVPLSFNELSDISQFFESFETVGPTPPLRKRVILIVSSDVLPTPVPSLQSFSLSTIHIPRTTDRTITNILRKHTQEDSFLTGSSAPTPIGVEEIARQARGDIRHAFHQLRWLCMNDNDWSSAKMVGFDRDTLHLHPDHVALKLLCGKEEYKAVSSLNFLDNVNKHFLIDSLFKNLLRYFGPSDTESLSKTLNSLSTIDTFGYTTNVDSNAAIYVFLSAYRYFNPEPIKSDVFTNQSNARTKHPFGELQEPYGSQGKSLSSSHDSGNTSLSRIQSHVMYPFEEKMNETLRKGDEWCRPLSDDDIE